MKKAKNVTAFVLVFVACFAAVVTVSAAGYKTLGYQETHQIVVDSMGPNFTTSITSASVNGVPTVKTQVGRKMFNLIWHDSGSTTYVFRNGGLRVTTPWSANGTWGTRATWSNVTSGTLINASFELY